MPAPFLRLTVLSWAVVGFATETSVGASSFEKQAGNLATDFSE